jgi:hypothetical protein
MTIPATAFIYEAQTSFKNEKPEDIGKELKEFRNAGKIDVAFPPGCTEMEKGYLIGIETTRVMLMQMPAAIQAGIKF